MFTIVLLVTYATLLSADQRLYGKFRHATVWIDVEPKNDPLHAATSIGVVRLGVRLGLESLSLTDFSDDLVEKLRW